MLQDPNVERVIKNYTEPLQKQISMMQIELEALKQQCDIGAVSGLLPIEDIKKAVYQFKKEELPDAEAPFHYEAEIWAGMQSFIRWLEAKQQ